MRTQTQVVTQSDLIAYVKDLLGSAMDDGYLEPIQVIECLQFAARPALLVVMRALSSFDESAQLEIIDFARRLTGQSEPTCPPEEAHRSLPRGR
jgi:hypothetical protein